MLRYPRRALTLVAGGGGMSRQSSVDRMSSPGALTNQDMPPIPVVNDDDLDLVRPDLRGTLHRGPLLRAHCQPKRCSRLIFATLPLTLPLCFVPF